MEPKLLYFPGILVLVEPKLPPFSRDFGPRGTTTAVFSRDFCSRVEPKTAVSKDFGPHGTKTTAFSKDLDTRLQDQSSHACVIFYFNLSLQNKSVYRNFYLFEIGLEKINVRNVLFCLFLNYRPKQKAWASNNFGANGSLKRFFGHSKKGLFLSCTQGGLPIAPPRSLWTGSSWQI